MKKFVVSLYIYLSILYAASAFSFRAIVIFGVKKFNNFNHAMSRYDFHDYTIHYYISSISLFLCLCFVAKYFHLNGNNLFVISFVSLSGVAMLHIAMNSWSYIESDWIRYRYDYEEDYNIAINIICLSMIMIPIFLGVMLTTFATNAILVYLFLIARVRYLNEFEKTAHDCMHRPILRAHANDTLIQRTILKLMYWIFNYFAGVLFLYPPHFYYYHHMHNHHRENCGPKDVTSAIHYNRQSISGFCRAALKFTISWTTGADLFIYLLMQKKFRIARNLVLSQCYFYSILYLVFLYCPLFSICLLLQHIVDGFMLAVVIWRWHAFIDISDPQNSFKNTTNIIFYGRFANYHTLHHEIPGMHSADVDDYLKKNRDLIVNSRMILLRNIRTMELVSLILTGKLDIIVQYFVNLGDHPISMKEITEILQLRLQPLTKSPATTCYFQDRIDEQLKKLMLRYNREAHRHLELNRRDEMIAPAY